MKRAGLWLCAASTLALAACHRPTQPMAAKPVAPPSAPPASAPAALKIEARPSATPVAAVNRPGAAENPSDAPKASSGRRHVAQRRLAHRLVVHDVAHRPRPAHGRASFGVHPAIARRDAGPPVLAPTRASAAYRACVYAAHGFTIALGDCYSAELARQGARVNQLYGAALATRSGRDEARLQQSQGVWARRRDAECLAGSTAAIDIQREGACRIDMTVRRADELERLVSARRRGNS